MVKLTCAEDVYSQLVEKSEEAWLYGLVAFAVVEEQRIEWMNHHAEGHDGHNPDADEIGQWYGNQPKGVLLRAKGEAENALRAYSDEVLQEILAVERKEVSDGVILKEIKMTQQFWRQFGINVIGGFVGTLIFAVFLAIFGAIVFSDTTTIELAKELLNNRTQE